MLSASYTTYAFAPHTHDTFAIGVTESGAQTFTYCRNRQLIMPAGSVAVVHPGEVHTSRATTQDGWTYRMLYPDPTLLQQAASEITDRQHDIPFFASPVIQDSYLALLIRNLHVALEDPTTPRLERESRLLWALAQLIVRHADSRLIERHTKPEHDCVRKAREYMAQRYAENITLQDLALFVNLSAFHLLRIFRDSVGLPPHAYLIQVRVKHAKHLLNDGVSIADAAAQTGFVDQAHLNKHFKRVVGVTPGQYRQNNH